MHERAGLALLLGIGTLAGGCALSEPTIAEQSASFARFADSRISDQRADEWLRATTAMLVSGAEVVDVQREGGRWSLRIVRGDSAVKGVAFASAVLVSGDGYFLTAAHAVEDTPLTLCIEGPEGIIRRTPRVVWRGTGQGDRAWVQLDPWRDRTLLDNRLDIAILYAEGLEGVSLQWSSHEMLEPGTDLLAGGLRAVVGGRLDRIVAASPRGDEPAWSYVTHDIPLRGGDSGSGLFTTDGRLVGVHAFTTETWELLRFWRRARRAGVAIRPDPTWVAALIDADRSARSSAP